MKKINLILLCLAFGSVGRTQSKANLPLSFFRSSDTSKPLVFYITGDGGMNNFSNSLMKAFNSKGYSVLALNAKDYFWKKKTPQQFSAELSTQVSHCLQAWKLKSFVLVGYSFGADVAPFMFSRLPLNLAHEARQLVLLSPSPTTTFEIKLLDMLGMGVNKGENVAAEINKIVKPVLLVLGTDENDFPLSQVTNKKVLKLPGGHHYDRDANSFCQQLIRVFQ